MTLVYPLNDERSFRIYCMRYDVTNLLVEGENVLGVMVGGGFYHQHDRRAEGNVSYGDIKLCYSLQKPSGTVCSDGSVLYQNGFFKKANLYHGETQDYTDFDRKWNTLSARTDGWKQPKNISAPKTEYYIADCPTDKMQAILKPTVVKRFDDYTVYALSLIHI